MKTWLVVARSNNYGLTSDAELLMEAIRAAGGDCIFAPVHTRGILDFVFRRRRADIVVHLERVFPAWLSAGERNWLMPNQERFPHRHIGRLRKIDLVLAKTRHAQDIYAALGVATEHVGFASRDRLEAATAKDWNRFLHLAGGSTLKGTEDLLTLWHRHPEWPELVLVQKRENAPRNVPANVTLHSGYLDDGALRRLQNECGIHLCPSRAEGWGHNIVEALGIGAVVVTTDAPPMNELVTAETGVLVLPARSEPRHLGMCYYADRAALERAIESILVLPIADKKRLSQLARARFESIERDFRTRVKEIVDTSG